MSSKKSVEIHKSHQNERKSKLNFEALLANLNLRMAFPWADNDYGIDGQVELISPIKNSESFRPDSKFFLIQLKSTESLKVVGKNISFSVPVKKVVQWFSANLPVMFVINDLKNKCFYSIWIDDILISTLDKTNSNWVNQGDVTLKIPIENNFAKYTLDTIRDFVLGWKISSRKIIEAGTYFELKDKCKGNLDSYTEISNPFKFESVNSSLITLGNQIEQAIYRIAITGPSRVGKSTLINALLKRKDISPTGFFQTTGVPIQILPDKEDFIRITFRSGKAATEKFSFKVIESYASQAKNEDNKKDVALVAIHLATANWNKVFHCLTSLGLTTLMKIFTPTHGTRLQKQMQFFI